MAARADIYEAIDRERVYQDSKWGDIWKHPHALRDWLNIMMKEIGEAAIAVVQDDDHAVRAEILQVIAVGVAALEQHGVVERGELR